MLRHLMVDGIEFLIIPVIVMDHSCLGIIRNRDTGNTAEVLIHMYMSSEFAEARIVSWQQLRLKAQQHKITRRLRDERLYQIK